jgi:hypothetical protein
MSARRRSRRNPFSLAIKSAEVMGAVPQVVSHRLARMATAGFPLEERDRKEFIGMAVEKPLAFIEAWQAMAAGMLGVNQAFLTSLFGGNAYSLHPHAAQLRLFERMLDPIHRQVTSNARRLRKTKLR